MSTPSSKERKMVVSLSLKDSFPILGIGSDEDEKTSTQGIEKVKLLPFPKTPPSALSLARSMIATNKTYKFRLERFATLTTSGAGAMALVTMIEPSGFLEYTQLSALFEECRLVRTRISYNMNMNVFGTTAQGYAGGPFCSAFDVSATTGATTSTTSVLRLNDCITFNMPFNQSVIRNDYKAPKGNPYSKVTASASGTEPTGGIKGGWCHVAQATLSNSIAYLTYYLEVIFEFRNRI